MLLLDMPVEILDIILSQLVPDEWNVCKKHGAHLRPRLVCRKSFRPFDDKEMTLLISAYFTGQFDHIISRLALCKLDPALLLSEKPGNDGQKSSINREAAIWLLTTKLVMCRGTKTKLALTVWNIVDTVLSWKSGYHKHNIELESSIEQKSGNVHESGSEQEPSDVPSGSFNRGEGHVRRRIPRRKSDEEQYLHVACSLLVVHQGATWACHQLQNPFGDPKPQGQTQCPEPGAQPPNSRNPAAEDEFCQPGLLQIASGCSEVLMVRTLLDHGADPNACDLQFGYPLIAAVYHKKESMVRVLIDRGVDLCGGGPCGWPVELAAERKDIMTERLLLDQYVRSDPKLANWALIQAAKRGYCEAVRVAMLRPDVDVNIRGPQRQTPLVLAAKFQHPEVMEELLRAPDVNPSAADRNHHTALYWATKWDLGEMVRKLLGQPDIHLNTPKRHGDSPLSLAVKNGNVGILQLLLAHDDIQLSYREPGRCPIEIAARMGRADILKLLLQRFRIRLGDYCVLTEEKRSLLCHAVHLQNIDLVRLLLQRKDINPNYSSADPPLHCAARTGNRSIMELLLKDARIDLNAIDSEGNTVLQIAVAKSDHLLLGRLLDEPNINPNLGGKDIRDAWPPLHRAVIKGNTTMILRLLMREDIDLNAVHANATPLVLAALYARPDALKLLLQRPETNPNFVTNFSSGLGYITTSQEVSVPVLGTDPRERRWLDKPYDGHPGTKIEIWETPLAAACRGGKDEVVQILLQDARTECNGKDGLGRTALRWAADRGHYECVYHLLDHPDTLPNVSDNRGWTALHAAVNGRYHRIVHRLAMHPDTDPNIRTNDGWTPLILAAGSGNSGALAMGYLLFHPLLHPKIELETALPDGRTAHEIAKRYGERYAGKVICNSWTSSNKSCSLNPGSLSGEMIAVSCF
ncbi:ankyrin repeat-containing domain protein [Xylariaceae sp. FL1272]|nr:ankyrin repeat-containing domain protein [Xylariaceae sp. FL1272]